MLLIIGSLILNLLIIWLMPKKITTKEIYISWGVLAAIALIGNMILGELLDFYDLYKVGYQPIDLLADALLAPFFGIIYLNFLPERSRYITKYIFCWVVFFVAYEWLLVYVGIEKLKGWSPWYSTIIYVAIFIFLRWHLRLSENNARDLNRYPCIINLRKNVAF